jgi:hypothetical protein
MFKLLWTHTRTVNVSVFQHKVVYRIPLYSDLLFKNAKIEMCHDGRELKLTTYLGPVEPHLEESSCGSQIETKVLLDESDTCSPSHQLPCRKTRCDSYALSTTSSILSG